MYTSGLSTELAQWAATDQRGGRFHKRHHNASTFHRRATRTTAGDD